MVREMKAMGRLRRLGSLAAQVGAVLAVGICVVLWHGATICKPSFLFPFACFSAVLVGPIVTASRRKDPLQGPGRTIARAVGRACGETMLILAVSIGTLNMLFWPGPPLLPAPGVFFVAAALSLTAASAAAGLMTLVLRRIPPELAKWGFRFSTLAAILAYRNLPPAWPPFWYGFIVDFGIVTVAFGLACCFAVVASGALFLLHATTGWSLQPGVAESGD